MINGPPSVGMETDARGNQRPVSHLIVAVVTIQLRWLSCNGE